MRCLAAEKKSRVLSLARAYDYGRKTNNDGDDEVADDLHLDIGADYFTRGEGSRNFTFGGKAVEERAPRDTDDGLWTCVMNFYSFISI